MFWGGDRNRGRVAVWAGGAGLVGVTFYYNIKIFLGQGGRNEGRRVGTGVGGKGWGSRVAVNEVGDRVGDGVGGNREGEGVWGFREIGGLARYGLNRAKNAVWGIL